MRVPARLFTDEARMKALRNELHEKEWSALRQLVNVTTLPGILNAALAMADIHPGYGFPIGGVGGFEPDEGVDREVLVHRNGATRAFGPGRPEVPERYRAVGQPVLVGGTMGTASYILHGTERGLAKIFGSALPGERRLQVVPGATHLFEEPGAMEAMIQFAIGWFGQYLRPNSSAA